MAQQSSGEAVLRQPRLLKLRQRIGSTPVAVGREVPRGFLWGTLLGSRALVWGGALLTMALFGHNMAATAGLDPQGASAPFRLSWLNSLFAPTARWDSIWYLQIAHAGYFSRASTAFFPLYPLMIHVGAGLLGSEILVATLISFVSFGIALYLLYLLARTEMSEEAARTTVVLIALFPTALFFSAVYTESLFLALSLGAIYAARLDRWGVAAILAALASASRVNGVLLLIPLMLIYLYGPRRSAASMVHRQWWRPRYRLNRSALWMLLVPIGLIAFLVYLWISHDAPLAPIKVQAELWRHQFVGPFGAVVVLVSRLPGDIHRLLTGHAIAVMPGDPISWTTHDLIDVGFLAFALAGLVLSRRRISAPLFIYGCVYLAYALSDPTRTEALQGFSRYVLLAFPVFMGWGGWLAERRLTRHAALAVSGLLLAGFSGLWGYWVWLG